MSSVLPGGVEFLVGFLPVCTQMHCVFVSVTTLKVSVLCLCIFCTHEHQDVYRGIDGTDKDPEKPYKQTKKCPAD